MTTASTSQPGRSFTPFHVAFFRNMNLGQARSKSPGSGVLLEAFTMAGAETATNFQTNGTVIFASSSVDTVMGSLPPLLRAATGYTDAVVVRSATWVRQLGQRLAALLPAAEVALFDAGAVPELELPWVDPSGNLTILELDAVHAVTSWNGIGTGSGSNPVLTRMLGVPVTCRGIPTMIRLAARLSRPVAAHDVSSGPSSTRPRTGTVRPSGSTR